MELLMLDCGLLCARLACCLLSSGKAQKGLKIEREQDFTPQPGGNSLEKDCFNAIFISIIALSTGLLFARVNLIKDQSNSGWQLLICATLTTESPWGTRTTILS